MSAILINMFFNNLLTDIIVTVFLGVETLLIIGISVEITDNKNQKKRTTKINEIYLFVLFIITLVASYLFY
ncbi:hypothetical protein HCJ52_08710 [Listeria sp. FSL L7-1485]|uniref:Uncharacterized protein n=1 Tax=Listeria immobilis TaxID=2713502 RepID=A0A7X0X7E1_9LIST|nr:hypothetical protein [Listeria immobilis]MBC1488909.1 hypothetical protein [Listeria immobilis]MBC1506021.1 hypothetical protein [Listeria immobilis]MBC1508665.1 hypothetical protein [Listeria immobilis]MBC1536206.1 hypothetical protein [Listeria immobilis]MBC6303028.1 hypothetical protein [Listeria immobilis]